MGTGRPILCLLNAQALTAFTGGEAGAVSVPLPEGVSAVDVTDLDEDGAPEVVAVVGERFTSCVPSVSPEQTDMACELFKRKNLLAETTRCPFPHVLVVEHEGEHLLAVPCERALELRRMDGTLVETVAYRQVSLQPASYERSFRACSEGSLGRGPAQSLDILVSSVIRPAADGVPGFAAAKQDPAPWSVPATRVRDASQQSPRAWPWFPLTIDGDPSRRARYALDASKQPATIVRIQELTSRQSDGDALAGKIGPVRRYPGSVLVLACRSMPDFNGDGYTDIVLWRAPAPGLSVDALARTITAGTWPVFVTTHLFAPQKNRYEPVPSGEISFQAPVSWFVSLVHGAPLRNALFADFNGDGKTDFGCSTSENSYSIWLYEDGWGKASAFARTFPEPVEGIAFSADIDGSGRTSLALRAKKAVYFLRATP